jgi:molybdate transport system substrate-binding protein
VFAGAAAQPALSELARAYEAKTGVKIDATFGGSGMLLTQFVREQCGDVYIPADSDFMDKAQQQGAVLEDTRAVLAYLVPMILVAKGNPKRVSGLKDLGRKDLRVALPEPKAAAIGDLLQAVLQRQGQWDTVKSNAASFVGNCEEGINILLMGEADVTVAWDVHARLHGDKLEGIGFPRAAAAPRTVPAAVIRWSAQPERARQFVAFVSSPEGKAAFRKCGYMVELSPPGSTAADR